MSSQSIAKPKVFVPSGPYPLLRYWVTNRASGQRQMLVLNETQMRREEVRTMKPFTRDSAVELMRWWNTNQKTRNWSYELID